ncbi:MAG: Uma2 family endonuclease [Thermoflexales bacterium]|nr:Uma2 family endonuclease [Thermoflexales bacterium]MCX7939597.1 Uma2 family endonuclease [Thermoflexales bacterium]MDW8292690.1 Uma2 family endonuclease [Anaerolineae bacterium]
MASGEALVPPLVPGEPLSRDEFERRHAAAPRLKAELIHGVVHVPPLAKVLKLEHAQTHLLLATWLGVYAAHTPDALALDNISYRVDEHNELQPDLVLMLRTGRAHIDGEGFLAGAPELVIEVAVSTAERDLGVKRSVYESAGVQEYAVWQVSEAAFSWWTLTPTGYRALEPDAEGVLRSEVFPGLWLDVPALLRRDLAAMLTRLNEGLRSAAHAAFVQQLR